MDIIYSGILVFLFILAVFDLSVGVSNDAVNFLSSAVGSKAAKFKTVLIIASIGILVGTSTSNGMMDIARHGILNPREFYFNEVMCIFLAVVATDVILLDLFNTLGLPTSTTVSMIFELLGGSTALALVKMLHNSNYSYADLINTDKALSVILGIFLSVAIAFIFGLLVMWISRVVFTFNYKKHMKWTIGLFGGLSITSIFYFLLTKGIGQASFMTPEIKELISSNNSLILAGSFIVFTVLMQVLHLFQINVLKIIVLFGTFSLAMAFAGNDLVNFIGVPLAGLSSYQDYMANGGGHPELFKMTSLAESAHTPFYFLILSGFVMIIALVRSKKARKVIETSVNLARQDEGEEVFSSSKIARHTVRSTMNATNVMLKVVPSGIKSWVNKRFQTEDITMGDGVAFDLVRASVNLVLAGLLIVIGTSMQLPLSTTYVAFMVAMGSSLADRAWGRESAVYRITGVISVIGGWFITAGAAFILCFMITNVMYFGGVIAMILMICLVAVMLINNNRNYKKKQQAEKRDLVFRDLIRSTNKDEIWTLLKLHVSQTQGHLIEFTKEIFIGITNGLMHENLKDLRHATYAIEDEKSMWKKYRRKEILGMRKIHYLLAVEKNTWFHLGCNNSSQIIYCLKRMCEPVIEHVDNNFNPLPQEYINQLTPIRDEIIDLLDKTHKMILSGNFADAEEVLADGNAVKSELSHLRHEQQNHIQRTDSNIKIDLLYLSTLQETQELISMTRHLLRASRRFQE
ncbi:MAG: inorganic phosphate transporter [Bacteroidaceae bacterium]